MTWGCTARLAIATVALVVASGCGSDEGPSEPQSRPTGQPIRVLFTESFDDGSDGAVVTPQDSIFTVVENEPATFSTTPEPVDGPLVGRYASTGENIRTKVEFTGTDGVKQVYERVYLWVDSYPSAVMRFLTFETSPDVDPPGEDVLALRMDPRGYLQVYDGSTFAASNATSQPLPLGEWVRLEVMYDSTEGEHGQSELQVFTGGNIDGTEPDDSVTVMHTASPTHAVTTAAFGVLNFVEVDFSLDAIEAATGGWVGPDTL